MLKTRLAGAVGLVVLAGAAFGGSPATAAPLESDVSVDTTDSADPVDAGTQFVYLTRISNAGPGSANGVHLQDVLPSRTEFVSVTSSQGSCGHKARKVSCSLGDVAAKDAATVSIRVKALKPGRIVNTATATTATPDPVASNNSDKESTTVVEPPPPVICAGQAATVVGTDGNDDLVGTNGPDVIAALRGDDTIDGLGGNDLVCAQGGNDTIRVRGGNDLVKAGGGDDRVKGGDGTDELRGGGGRDRLNGGSAIDSLDGGSGHDRCHGGPGRDSQRSC